MKKFLYHNGLKNFPKGMDESEKMDFTIQQIKNIMEREDFTTDTAKDWTFEGLRIISRYTNRVIINATNGKIFSEEVKHLIIKGITVEDIQKLAQYGFTIENGSFVTII